MVSIEDYTKRKWHINRIKRINGKNLIMIEGLTGMGNVGKIETDLIIENIRYRKRNIKKQMEN